MARKPSSKPDSSTATIPLNEMAANSDKTNPSNPRSGLPRAPFAGGFKSQKEGGHSCPDAGYLKVVEGIHGTGDQQTDREIGKALAG